MSESTKLLHGACFCGAIRFEVTAPTRFCAHCHCSMCRRAHMAPLVTWSGVPDGQLRITAGAAQLTRYASSPEATRSFCSICGSQLFFTSKRWPGETHIATASLLEGPDKLPTAHVFYSDRADWFACEDALIKCGGPTGVEPLS
jgi:hypothetical protein